MLAALLLDLLTRLFLLRVALNAGRIVLGWYLGLTGPLNRIRWR